jgi:hypothetical protein
MQSMMNVTLFAEPWQGEETGMAEKAGGPSKRDYSSEILSFIVLVLLSALSHFWYIVIAISVGIVFLGALALFGQLMLRAAGKLPWHVRSKRTIAEKTKDGNSEPQVFLPRKIRQSVDC